MSQQTNDPNSNLQRRAHRTTNQRIWNIENQFLTGGVSLKDIARGVVINSQMIDNLRQNPGVTQEQKVTYKRQDNQQSNIQSEVIKLSALSDIDYYDDTGTQQTTGASVKVNRITTTTDTTGNLFVITNDGKVIMYNKRTNPAIVYDLTSNDVLTFRNDTNQVKLRFNRVDGKITASVLESSQCDIISGGYLNFLSGSTNYYRMYRDGTDLKLNSTTNGTIYTISNTGVITATNHINTSGNIVADGTITANGGFITSNSLSTEGNITAQGFVQVGDDLRVSGNAGFGMTPTYKVDVNGSARISTALGIGTAPDGANPLKVEGNTLINGNLRISSESQMDGNVGIGGAVDGSSKLRVVGDALIDGGSASSANLKLKKNGQQEQSVVRMDNSGQIYIGSSESGKNTFIDAGGSTSIMVDGSTNNVGIGGNPSYLMDVAGSGRIQTALGIATAPNSSIPLVVNGKTNLQSNTGIGVTPDSTHDLLVNGSTRLSGNVGVGTAATSNKFEVSGSGKFTQYIGVGGADPNASYPLHVTGNSKLNGRVGVNGDPDSTHALLVNGSANVYNSASGDAELWFKSGTTENKTIVMQNDGDVYFQSTDGETYLRGNNGIRFETDTGSGFAEHMTITQAGNVGIGQGYTPSSSYILDTNNNVRFGLSTANSQLAIGGSFKSIGSNEAGIAHANDSVTQYAIKQNSSGQTELNAEDGQAMIFNINDSQQMILDSSGNLGIGTSSPNYNLDVPDGNQHFKVDTYWQGYGGAAASFGLHLKQSTTGNTPLMQFAYRNFDTGTEQLALQINSLGYVGIGASSPGAPLEVQSGSSITEIRVGNTSFTDALVRCINNSMILGLGYGDSSNAGSSNLTNLTVRGPGGISFDTYDSGPYPTTKMKLDNTGRLGIGTSSPTQKLEVYDGDILIYPSTSSSFNIKSGLNAGVETILDIKGDGETLRLGSGNTPYVGTFTTHPFRLTTNGQERLYINIDGNIGIGTSAITSGYKLDVNGSQVIRDNLYVQDNVGIGTSSPTQKLDVRGSFVVKTGLNSSTRLYVQEPSISAAGSVGIGTESPLTDLHVSQGNYKKTQLTIGSTKQSTFGQNNGNGGQINFRGVWHQNGNETDIARIVGEKAIGNDTKLAKIFLQINGAFQGNDNFLTGISIVPNTTASQASHCNVGIGTTSPDERLHVNGNIKYSGSLISSSDRRIKNHINDINDSKALNMIRNLQPKTYNYINYREKGNSTVIGYIAQEVADVIPDAVIKTNKDVVPSIYSQANCSVHNNKEIAFNYDDMSNITVGDKIKFFLENEQEHIGNVTHLDNSSFTLSLDQELTNVNATSGFLYGKEVDDFHTLNKQYIFTVATAALQELDRDHEKTKAELATTKQELATANQKIDLLLQRMEALEKLVNSS